MWAGTQSQGCVVDGSLMIDDGTVVGLSRADMDASLHTLELMASEVGATVLVLKEIVLANPIYSSGSFTSAESWASRDDSPAGWVVPKPKPRVIARQKSTIPTSKVIQPKDTVSDGPGGAEPKLPAETIGKEGLEEEDPKQRKKRIKKIRKKRSWKRRERRTAWLNGEEDGFGEPSNKEKQIVFDTANLSSSGDDEEIDEFEHDPGSRLSTRAAEDDDYDVPPFHLDLEDAEVMIHPGPRKRFVPLEAHENTEPNVKGWPSRKVKQPTPSKLSQAEQKSKTSAKARKAMERREARRMDLLRGDGMTPSPFDIASEQGGMSIVPHAPARPSSLRLATPAPDITASTISTSLTDKGNKITLESSAPEEEAEGDDSFLQNLLSLPLDSLSLSFADVRTITPSSPSLSASSISSTEYAPTQHETEGYVEKGDERICVEALVVRKVAVDEDEWGWGGDDDAWGLSGDGDGEEAPELSVYDICSSLTPTAGVVSLKNTDGLEAQDEDAAGASDPWGFG